MSSTGNTNLMPDSSSLPEPGLNEIAYLATISLRQWVLQYVPQVAKGVLFDYGCGGQPFRSLLDSRLERYIGGDVGDRPEVDVQLETGVPVPLSDESCDTILSTQVLEHVPDPNFYLSECRRLLKVGSFLILSAPMQWRMHGEPNDFYRFTRYGLSQLLTAHGFDIERIDPCGGAFALAGQIIVNSLHETRRTNIYRSRTRCYLNRLFAWLDRRYPDYGDTINWACIAKRVS